MTQVRELTPERYTFMLP
jgi:hypothetical protein